MPPTAPARRSWLTAATACCSGAVRSRLALRDVGGRPVGLHRCDLAVFVEHHDVDRFKAHSAVAGAEGDGEDVGRLVTGHPQRQQLGVALEVAERAVEAVDRRPTDVHITPDRVLNRGVVGEQLDDVVGATVGDQLEVAVDGRGDGVAYIRGTCHVPKLVGRRNRGVFRFHTVGLAGNRLVPQMPTSPSYVPRQYRQDEGPPTPWWWRRTRLD